MHTAMSVFVLLNPDARCWLRHLLSAVRRDAGLVWMHIVAGSEGESEREQASRNGGGMVGGREGGREVSPPPPPVCNSYALVQATAGVGTVLIWGLI